MLQAHYQRMDEIAKVNQEMVANIESAKSNQSRLLRSEIKQANQKIGELSDKIDQMKAALERVAPGAAQKAASKVSLGAFASLKSSLFS